MKKKQIAITLGIMCFLLTIALCVQIKTMNSANSTVSQSLADNELRDEVLRMKEKYDNAYRDLANAQKELEKVRQEATQNDSTAEAKEQALRENNMILGRTDVQGEGVEVILEDAASIFFSSLFKRCDGTIEINGQRLVNTSSITCEGNIIRINGERIGTPFYIRAIGSQSRLYGALTRAGSILDAIAYYGNRAEVTKVDNIVISRYSGTLNYEYLKEDK